MATVSSSIPMETLDDLFQRVGQVPFGRVRLQPPPGTATEADVLSGLNKQHKQLCELIDGVLVEKTVGFRESLLAVYLCAQLDAFVRPAKLGIVLGPDGMIRLWPGRVRIPDVAFIRWERLPERRIPVDPIPEVAPNLAIEILSQGNTPSEMSIKRRDYFSAGVQLVWEVDLQDRKVSVFNAPDEVMICHESDTLEGGIVIPNFSLNLHELFAELDRQG